MRYLSFPRNRNVYTSIEVSDKITTLGSKAAAMQFKPKVLALFDVAEPVAMDRDYSEELKTSAWKTEADVLEALQILDFPYDVLAIHDDTIAICEKVRACKPDVVFNLVEQFKNNTAFEQHVTSFLELQGIPFTGCGSTGMTLCKHKGISKKILGYHRIRVPEFTILPRGRRVVRPKRLGFPIFVKPLQEEASTGIAQASFVETDEQFKQRVQFIHDRFNQPAIAEQYIEGREIYVSILGNERLQVFPIRELTFREVPLDEPRFASHKVKWDEEYRKRWGIDYGFAGELENGLLQKIERTCKKIYRLLAISGYARIDLRLTAKNELYFIEANPNPHLANDEDFAESAKKANLPFPNLIERIIDLGRSAVRS